MGVKKKKDISVVLPAYNEEENIPLIISKIQPYLKKNFGKYEIIVVDDGSRDKTGKIVKDLQKTRPWLRLVTHPKNRGYGAALRSGFTSAKMPWVFYTDSDNQFDINDLDKLMPLTEKFDIVAGYREHRQDPYMRIFIAWVYNQIIWLSLGLKIRDIDCAFKIYKKQVFDKIKMTSETGLIDAEVLVKAKRAGFTIGQTGVRHFPRTLGQTVYEVGGRNKFFAFVKPQVVMSLLYEIGSLRRELG